MTTDLIPNSDMQVFSPADIKRAGELLHCPLDESSAIKALIIQRDTGLSLARGEISIVPFNGRPTVMINKQGYLAYAARQPNYDGYESGIETIDGETSAWCVVYDKNVSHPVKVRIYQKEYAKQTPIWKEKPRYMLEKTAISLALRAAFPILNGTYEDGEIEPDTQPVKIDRLSTDIEVNPEPVRPSPAPASAPKSDEIKTTAVYTAEQVSLSILPNYEAHKLNMDIFKTAKLPNGMYDKNMIDADYKAQMFKPQPEPEPTPAPETHTESGLDEYTAEIIQDATENHKRTIDQPFCVDCGNTRVLADEEKASRAKYGVALCPDCMSKRIASDLKAKQLAKAGEDALQNLVKASSSSSSASTKQTAPSKPSKQTKPTAEDSPTVCSICGKKMTKGELSKWHLFNPGKPIVCSDCLSKQSEN